MIDPDLARLQAQHLEAVAAANKAISAVESLSDEATAIGAEPSSVDTDAAVPEESLPESFLSDLQVPWSSEPPLPHQPGP